MSARPFGWSRALAVVFLFVFIGLVATLFVAGAALPLDRTTVTIDGERVALSGIDGWHGILLACGLAVAVFVALIVAALAVIFALGVAVLAIVVALVAVVATMTVAASPLIVLGWVIWRIVRPAPRALPALPA